MYLTQTCSQKMRMYTKPSFMKTKFLTFTVLLFFPFFLSAQSFQTIFKNSDWLNKHLEDKDLIILHVDTKENYDAGHIPGAQLILMSEYVTRTTDSIYTELPDNTYLDSLFRARGISDQSKVVLYYGGERFASTFRLYYTFDYLGMSDNIFILDGGLTNWNKSGLSTSMDSVIVTPTPSGDLNFTINSSILVDKEDVQKIIGADNIKIIDARTDAYYSGEKDGDGHYKRPGHIAGAKNITWLDILDEDQNLKPKEVLQQYFEDQGIEKNDEVITYCHVGLRATVLYTIAKGLGHSSKMYDGSFNEWDRLDDQFPVQNTYQKE